jgi:hypothetical protein
VPDRVHRADGDAWFRCRRSLRCTVRVACGNDDIHVTSPGVEHVFLKMASLRL